MKTPRCPYEKKPGVILDHLEGVLPEKEAEPFARHLAEFPRCAAELAEYAGVLALARSGPAPEPAPGTAGRLRAAIRREIAAAEAGGSGHARSTAVPRWNLAGWRRLAVAVPALAAIALLATRLTLHAPDHTPAPPGPLVTTTPDTAGVASNPELATEISAYESDDMREFGTDTATDSLDQNEQQAFARLLDQELEALMKKRAANGERSSLSTSREELS
jgi:hypothetical protein